MGVGRAIYLRNNWNKLIQGWTTSGVLYWVSGNPISVTSGLGTWVHEDFSSDNTANTPFTRTDLNSMLTLRMTGNGPYFVPLTARMPHYSKTQSCNWGCASRFKIF